MRKIITMEIHGVEYTFKEATKKFEIKESTLRNRYSRGLRGKKLIQPLIKQGSKTPFNNKLNSKATSIGNYRTMVSNNGEIVNLDTGEVIDIYTV